METETSNKNAKLLRNAVLIGVLTVLSYMIGYYIRKLLGQARPSILADGAFAAGSLDSFQSLYLIFYAIGQLVNGTLGDYLPPKYMVGGGFLLAGIACFVFPATNLVWLSLICFAMLGFGLSMLRGPMMKIITENNPPKISRMISLIFRFGSHIATWITTLFLTLFQWREAFSVSGLVMLITATVFFLSVSGMQKADIVKPIVKEKSERKKLSLKEIFGVFAVPGFLFYFCISCIVEICNTGITYYLPSYLTEFLGFSEGIKNTGMSVFSTLMAACSFVILPMVKLAKWHDERLMRYVFSTCSFFFLCTVFLRNNPWLNMILAFSAMLCIGCMGALVWGVYLPGLGKTGKVSGANGTLDCFGYLAAALGNLVFSKILTSFGWNGLQVVWIIVPLIGTAIACFRKKPCVSEE